MKIKYFIKIKVQNSRFSTSRADPFIRGGGGRRSRPKTTELSPSGGLVCFRTPQV